MARRQILVDDIDGSEDNVETVSFAWEGVTYLVDLSEANRDALVEALAPFVNVATPLDRNGRPKPRVVKRAANRKSDANREVVEEVAVAQEIPEYDTKLARAWLREHGYEVQARGRIRDEVVVPYINSDDFKAWQEQQ